MLGLHLRDSWSSEHNWFLDSPSPTKDIFLGKLPCWGCVWRDLYPTCFSMEGVHRFWGFAIKCPYSLIWEVNSCLREPSHVKQHRHLSSLQNRGFTWTWRARPYVYLSLILVFSGTQMKSHWADVVIQVSCMNSSPTSQAGSCLPLSSFHTWLTFLTPAVSW